MLKFLFIFILLSNWISAENTCFTIFSFNDTYSIFQEKQLSDLSRIMTLLKSEKQKADSMITLMNGKIPATYDKADSFIEVINQMGIDYVCVSQGFFKNHLTKSFTKKPNYHYLAANCIGEDNLPYTKNKQVHVFTINGIKIGLFGLIDIPADAKEDKILCISPFFIAKQKALELKKQGVDVIVVVTQLENMQDRYLAQNVPEIDVIIGCTQNEPISWFEGKTFVHQTSLKEPHITRIDIHIQKKSNPWRTNIEVLPTWHLIVNDNDMVTPDAKIVKMIEELENSN